MSFRFAARNRFSAWIVALPSREPRSKVPSPSEANPKKYEPRSWCISADRKSCSRDGARLHFRTRRSAVIQQFVFHPGANPGRRHILGTASAWAKMAAIGVSRRLAMTRITTGFLIGALCLAGCQTQSSSSGGNSKSGVKVTAPGVNVDIERHKEKTAAKGP
jgi:hypothetical protein